MAEITPISNHRNQLLSLPGELVYDYISVDYSLPDGYTQLEYIQSTTSQYLNLNISNNKRDIHLEIDFTPTSWNDSIQPSFASFFSIQCFASGAGTPKHFAIWSSSGSSHSSIYCNLNQRYYVVYGATSSNTVYYQIDNNARISRSGVRSYTPVVIGCYKGKGSAIYFTGMYLYGCKVYVDDVLIRDLVPVKRNSDNVAGMYDLASGGFFSSSGTDQYIAGPIIVYKFHKEGQYDYWMKVTQKTPLYDDNGNFYDFSVTGPCIYKDTVAGSINVGVQTISNVLSRKTHLAQDNFDSISISNDHNSILYSITPQFQTIIDTTTELSHIGSHRSKLLQAPVEVVYDTIYVDWTTPSGYTSLEYIESSSDAYVDLQQTFTTNTGIDIDFALTGYQTSSKNYPLFGTYNGGLNYLVMLRSYIRSIYWQNTHTFSDTSATALGMNRHNISSYKGTFKKDGILVYNGPEFQGESSDNLVIFGFYHTHVLNEMHLTAKLYGVRLYGDKNANLVPVRRNSDNALGLLDTVSSTFYLGSGTWTAGQPLEDLEKNIYLLVKSSDVSNTGDTQYIINVTNKTPKYDSTGILYDFDISGPCIQKNPDNTINVGIQTISNVLSRKTHLTSDNFGGISKVSSNVYNSYLYDRAYSRVNEDYFSMTSMQDGGTIAIAYRHTSGTATPPSFQYSYDSETWTNWPYTIEYFPATDTESEYYIYQFSNIDLDKLDTIYIQSGASRLGASTSIYSNFRISGPFVADGNIMSLINFETAISSTHCFYRLFQNCTGLIKSPKLPAITLANCCYDQMFYGCTGLTQVPELPATIMKTYCYYGMFRECTHLLAAPKLPATTLADYCYDQMFYGCTRLLTAPKLPATNIAVNGCYYYMFFGSGLIQTPELPAASTAYYCYNQMFRNCDNLYMVSNLPANPTSTRCYYYMFYDCAKIKYIKVGATTWNSSNSDYWLSNVPSTGTFVKPASLEIGTETGQIPRSVAGIPSGWTVIDI